MTDPEILRLLASLGIDDLSYRALPLLPLLHVAWADGEIQDEERELVDEVLAKRNLGLEAERLVRNWLTFPPSADYIDRGRVALVALAMRGGDLQLEEDILSDVLGLSKAVARAAGGLFGLGSISREEKQALSEIANALDVTDQTRWAEAVQRELAEDHGRQRVLIKFNTDTLDLGTMPGVLTPVGDPDLQIPVEGALTLGRDPGCDVVVNDPMIGPRHCEIRLERTLYYVRDLDSSGGTWVDGERIVERRLLGGETIRLGAAELRFQLLRRVPDQLL